jgi:hypothetical protein
MVITAGQIVWTAECEKALSDAEGAKQALRLLKKKWVSYLNKLTAVTRSKLNKIDRNKVRGQHVPGMVCGSVMWLVARGESQGVSTCSSWCFKCVLSLVTDSHGFMS